jgi:uncharacterized protein
MEPKDLITQIAQALVDHPEEVSVNVIEGESSVMFELTVSKSDIGKVIGKQGRTAQAIRTILRGVVAGKAKKLSLLEIIE